MTTTSSTKTASAQTLPRGFPGYVALLRDNKDVRNIWFAQVISQMGDWFNIVALLGLINRLTPDPVLPALVTAFLACLEEDGLLQPDSSLSKRAAAN